MINKDQKKLFILGFNIKYSRSPLIHNYWFKKYGINAKYDIVEIDPVNIGLFLNECKHDKDILGFNITIPHKQMIYKYADVRDEDVEIIGSSNTVKINDGKILSYNTDAYGYIENLKRSSPNLKLNNKFVILIGAGGAARSICYGLIKEGVSRIYVANRTIEKANELAKINPNIIKPIENCNNNIECNTNESNIEILSQTDLFINSTSLGMVGHPPLKINISNLPPSALVSDIVYTPLETELLLKAKSHNLKTSQGLGMLIYQAQKAFEIWFGIKPEVSDELFDLVISDLK